MNVETIGFMVGCWALGFGVGRGWRMVSDFLRESV